jgi:hypothetical protein
MWTAELQRAEEAKSAAFAAEFRTAMEAWKNQVQSGQPDAGKSIAAAVLERWRGNSIGLQNRSEQVAESGLLQELGTLSMEVIEQRQQLDQLKGELGTRVDQAISVNPKVRSSAYTNILGLNRIFRSSTWWNLVVASTIFGVLAAGMLGFLVYQIFYGSEARVVLFRGS